MKVHSVLVLLTMSVVGLVRAQSNEELESGISPCILECTMASAQQNDCGSVANLQCTCRSPQFLSDTRACLETRCSREEVEAVERVQRESCAAAGFPLPPTPPPPPRSLTDIPTIAPSTTAMPSSSAEPSASGTPDEIEEAEEGGTSRSARAGQWGMTLTLILGGVLVGFAGSLV